MPSALKPWHAVAIPHDDIQKGRLSEAVFAANLWAVLSSQRGPTICTAQADAHVGLPVAVAPLAGWTPASSKTVKCLSPDCARR